MSKGLKEFGDHSICKYKKTNEDKTYNFTVESFTSMLQKRKVWNFKDFFELIKDSFE